MGSISVPRLDDLYKMVTYIYGDKLNSRSSAATFSHLVEVCGMLTIHDRAKKREGFDVVDALCKALGWYFPLLAKFKVKSVEALIFRKFPAVCPYCREAPHNEAKCKLVKGTASTVNHQEVEDLFRQNWPSRPATLNEWQKMFQKIYPRQLSDRGRSTVGLLEELGELAEAVRVGEAHPKYLLGEAADLFSYLAGIANEHEMRVAQEGGTFSFQDEFLKRYPGLCTQCGHKICICPSIPEATIGRMAKELNIRPEEQPFLEDMQTFTKEGEQIARNVLELLGGYAGFTAQLPFDRGDTNRALILLCSGIANAVEATSPQLASSLRAEVVKIGTSVRSAGQPRQQLDLDNVLREIAEGWKSLSADQKMEIKEQGNLVGDLGDILDTLRVLVVHCSPQDAEHIRVTGELRIIREVAKNATINVKIDDLPAAQVNDLRTNLLRCNVPYNVIHFSGHANAHELVFENENGESEPVSLEAISKLLATKTQCVILNACNSVQNLSKSVAPYTIGMNDTIDDDVALEFSRGFYDALSVGRNFEEAYEEGLTAVGLKGGDTSNIKMLRA